MKVKQNQGETLTNQQGKDEKLVTVPIVLPAQWRDDLCGLAALRSAQSGKPSSRSALLRDLLRPLMASVRAELSLGREAISESKK